MEISETDVSPSAYSASRNISCEIYADSVYSVNETITESHSANQMAQPQSRPTQILMENSTHTPNSSNSPNGNSLETSELTFQDACSSPDQLLDDVMNSNERLDCSDNENLERLNRKVIELINENRLSIQSNNTNSETNTSHLKNENGNASSVTMLGEQQDLTASPRIHRITGGSMRKYLRNTSRQNSQTSQSGEIISNANGESNEEHAEDSWSDEEGEDTDYKYSLRRRR